MVALRVVGWIFVPYIMVFVYAIQNKEQLFTEKSSQHLIRLALGVVWALILVALVVSNPDKQTSQAGNATGESASKTTQKDADDELMQMMPKVTYNVSIKAFNNGEYDVAMKGFKTIPDFKDSKEYIEKCKNQLKEKSYADAVKLFNEGNIEKALGMFQSLGTFKDATDFAAKAQQEIEKANKEKESKYIQAVKYFDAEKYEKAKAVFVTLGDYKETAEYLQKIKDVPPYPKSQAQFMKTVDSFIDVYKEAPNQLKKSVARTKRGKEIEKVLNGRRSIRGWIGTIKSLETNSEGKAIVEIELLDSDITLKTWNNALSDVFDKTLISQKSKIFRILSEMERGAQIIFSGTFAKSNKNDFVREGSLTEAGSMTDPEFIFRFKKVAPFKNE